MPKKFTITATIDLPDDAIEQASQISAIAKARVDFETALTSAFGRTVRMDTKIMNARPVKEAAGSLAPVAGGGVSSSLAGSTETTAPLEPSPLEPAPDASQPSSATSATPTETAAPAPADPAPPEQPAAPAPEPAAHHSRKRAA